MSCQNFLHIDNQGCSQGTDSHYTAKLSSFEPNLYLQYSKLRSFLLTISLPLSFLRPHSIGLNLSSLCSLSSTHTKVQRSAALLLVSWVFQYGRPRTQTHRRHHNSIVIELSGGESRGGAFKSPRDLYLSFALQSQNTHWPLPVTPVALGDW